MPPRVVYLHGFASSPSSKKARYFASHIEGLEVPDLNGSDFSNITLTHQLSILDALVGGEKVSLMGSSLGGYLAALYAARHANVDRLVLLAPAFQFSTRLAEGLGAAEVTQWELAGARSFFHYGAKEEARLNYRFLQDARQHEAEPDVRQPCLICHGVHDDVVPIELSRAFASTRPNVELLELDSDHELLNVTDLIWDAARAFLQADAI